MDFVDQLTEIIREAFPDEPAPFLSATKIAKKMKERGMPPYDKTIGEAYQEEICKGFTP
jgi:hypothetical protein